MKQVTILISVAMVCISASVVTKTIFIPATPKQVFAEEEQTGAVAIDKIYGLHKNGWVNIHLTASDSYSYNPTMIITAEKY